MKVLLIGPELKLTVICVHFSTSFHRGEARPPTDDVCQSHVLQFYKLDKQGVFSVGWFYKPGLYQGFCPLILTQGIATRITPTVQQPKNLTTTTRGSTRRVCSVCAYAYQCNRWQQGIQPGFSIASDYSCNHSVRSKYTGILLSFKLFGQKHAVLVAEHRSPSSNKIRIFLDLCTDSTDDVLTR